MSGFIIETTTVTTRKYYVEAESPEDARDTFFEEGANLEEEMIVEENIENVREV